jgi:hypothetical protein
MVIGIAILKYVNINYLQNMTTFHFNFHNITDTTLKILFILPPTCKVAQVPQFFPSTIKKIKLF